jgi:uncharacterized protein YraI
MYWNPLSKFGFIILLAMLILPVSAQDHTPAQTITPLNLRIQPSGESAVITLLNPRTSVVIEGRNTVGNWVLIHSADGSLRGWVATRFLSTPDDFVLDVVSVTEEAVVGGQTIVVEQPAESVPATNPAPVVNVDSGFTGTVIAATLNVRAGADANQPSVGMLTRNTAVVIEGRNAIGNWALVQAGGLRGWVASRYLKLAQGVEIANIPVTGEAVNVAAAPADSPAVSVSPDVAAMEAQLATLPIVPGTTARAHAIFQRGLQVGRRSNLFTKVGDCNSENVAFMYAFDWGSYNLGEFVHLQPTVNYFAGSFARESLAGKGGYSAVTAIDALWADPAVCNPGEASVFCEYRLSKASFSVIMFGANDISRLTPEQYETAMRQILDLSIQANVVPILSTFTTDPAFPDRWAKSLQLNLITVNLAREYDVPIMNFWLAARDLPAAGMTGDNAHLSAKGGRIDFTGEQNQMGFTMRNLVVLQTLDVLRRDLLGG